MKKFLSVALFLSLIFCFAAAESHCDLPSGQIFEITSGTMCDFDGENSPLQVTLETEYIEDYGAFSFTLRIGDAAVTGEGENLTGSIHLFKSDAFADTLIFISDNGMSDDYYCHVYSYYNGEIRSIGYVGCLAQDLLPTSATTLTGQARGSILHTWYRPADYIIATSYEEPDYVLRARAVCEMPRSEYPMGAPVTVLADIDLQVSRTNPSHAYTLKAGDKAVIVSTDDIEWLYIVPLDPSYDYERTAGWLRTDIGGYTATINGTEYETWNLFDGLFYAD